MKIKTFNINGVRRFQLHYPGKNFQQILEGMDSAIICLQELKISKTKLDSNIAIVDGFESYFSFPKFSSNYSGVATYVKSDYAPIAAYDGFSKLENGDRRKCFDNKFTIKELDELDSEGRCVITDHSIFVLINCYFPSYGRDRETDHFFNFKENFNKAIEILLHSFRAEKCIKDHELLSFGDTPCRKWLDSLLNSGLKDLFRYYEPNTQKSFTCWNYLTNARESNYGTRIDYIIVSDELLPWCKSCKIEPYVYGSDHCPVLGELYDTHPEDPENTLLQHFKNTGDRKIPSICSSEWKEFQGGKQGKITSFLKRKGSCDSENILESTNIKIEGAEVFKNETVEMKETSYFIERENIFNNKKIKKKQQVSISNFFNKNNNKKSIEIKGSVDVIENKPNSSSVLIKKSEELFETSYLDSEKLEKIIEVKKLNDESVKNDWSKILKKPAKPLCYHGEEAKQMTVNKSGPNKGKIFYMCKRPVGSNSNSSNDSTKEKLGEFRCKFFKWFK
ncbi:DNA-(apurinic or apyrimidinic site) lyase 2 [Clydaea vesicula]|uniref:DNA-(apurinic or apyrimidinic site) endonuclease 2 n=1 Tax=Clydaea vesicula TaxID=447962 RepID=A0AAD5XZA6_9FUNG|nr:DNA-(apurinic or apyrimidinic site) lyase 2 [Clydaea vesicula]